MISETTIKQNKQAVTQNGSKQLAINVGEEESAKGYCKRKRKNANRDQCSGMRAAVA